MLLSHTISISLSTYASLQSLSLTCNILNDGMIVIIHKCSYTKCWLDWVLFERKRPWLSSVAGGIDCSLFLWAKFAVKQHLFHNILPLSCLTYWHNCSSCAWHSGGWWGHREGRCCNCHPGVGWCTDEGCGGQDCSQWQVSIRREVNSIVANLKCNHAVSPATCTTSSIWSNFQYKISPPYN